MRSRKGNPQKYAIIPNNVTMIVIVAALTVMTFFNSLLNDRPDFMRRP
jgi:hypothetical protein